jgi:hypothetical protein
MFVPPKKPIEMGHKPNKLLDNENRPLNQTFTIAKSKPSPIPLRRNRANSFDSDFADFGPGKCIGPFIPPIRINRSDFWVHFTEMQCQKWKWRLNENQRGKSMFCPWMVIDREQRPKGEEEQFIFGIKWPKCRTRHKIAFIGGFYAGQELLPTSIQQIQF